MLKIALQVWSLGPVFSIAGNLLLHIILNRKNVQEIFLVSAKTRLTSRMDWPFMTALFSPTPAFPVRKQHEPGWAQALPDEEHRAIAPHHAPITSSIMVQTSVTA